MEIILLMAELFEGQVQLELAQRHAQLALTAYGESGGKAVPKNLTDVLYRLEVPLDNPPLSDDLRRNLVPVWKRLQPQVERANRGSIDYIHGNGKSGRVRSDDGKSYFFGVKNFRGDPKRLQSGLAVTFNLREGLGKDGSPEMHAVDLVELK